MKQKSKINLKIINNNLGLISKKLKKYEAEIYIYLF